MYILNIYNVDSDSPSRVDHLNQYIVEERNDIIPILKEVIYFVYKGVLERINDRIIELQGIDVNESYLDDLLQLRNHILLWQRKLMDNHELEYIPWKPFSSHRPPDSILFFGENDEELARYRYYWAISERISFHEQIFWNL